MRRLLGLLRGADDLDTLTPQPGLRDIDQLISDVRRAGVEVTMHMSGAPRTLPPGLDLTAYRIVQEALTNVLKHSRPAVCAVHLGYEPESVNITVTDEGGACDRIGAGRGLTGMQERVSIFNGTLSAGPRHPHGFEVDVRLPVAQ